MMWKSREPRFDVASAICQGGRDYQEDAIVADFPAGADTGVVVLADGMGGHAAGDIASKIVVTEVYSDLKYESVNFAGLEKNVTSYLKAAAANANECISDHVQDNPETQGMGATLVAMVMVENRMYWMSIGDSPLYLLRNGKLRQLNEDHSLAPQIDFMVSSGLIGKEEGENHPDRNCLTSVIIGQKVAKADCPATPFTLEVGDIVVISSDGLQYLTDAKIEKILRRHRRKKSSEITEHLLDAIHTLADPDQDNVSFSVIKLNHNKPAERTNRRKPVGSSDEIEGRGTRLVVENETQPDAPASGATTGKPVLVAQALPDIDELPEILTGTK